MEAMTTEIERSVDEGAWTIEAPAEVDAGAEFTVRCQVALSPEIAGTEPVLSIRNMEGEEVATAGLSEIGPNSYDSGSVQLRAPLTPGAQEWQASIVRPDGEGDGPSVTFSFTVKAHAMRLNAWDLPSAIVAGEVFSFKVGIKCSSGCCLSGREVAIVDGEGCRVAAGKLRDEVWPGTGALYYAVLEATAPAEPGPCEWRIEIPPIDEIHAPGATALPLQVVARPDCEVCVEVVDAESGAPIKGARVMMHPYKTLAGEDGLARLHIVKGDYRLLVSGTRYLASAQTVEVRDDVALRVELRLEPVQDPASYYV
jgi:hypothetical protein